MRQSSGILALLLTSTTLLAQSPAPPAAFEAADVHVRVRSSNPNPFMTGGVLRGGRYDLRNATMVDLIATAYGVNPEVVFGGPNWLERDRFDIIAKAPQATSEDGVRTMLQNLLAERFTLVIRRDTKAMAGFALEKGTGAHKLKEAAPGGPGACMPQPPQPPQPGVVPYAAISCRGITLDTLVQQLRAFAGAYVPGPTIDATGLAGAWDFDLKWTQRALLAQAGSDGITLADAVDKQLGLKLEARQVPQSAILVERVNQRPSANPSGVAATIPPPPPAEFDVATIRLSPPGTNANPIGRLQPGGRIDLQNFPLRGLISMAWDINSDELLAAPKWIDDKQVTVVARTSAAAIGGAANGVQLDIDDVRLMLQALLVERFKIKTHVEDRPVTAYTLLTDKPKMPAADAVNRTTCKNGPGANGRDPRNSNPALSRLVTCQNITMAQFADDLPRMAPGYLRTPVTDATGLSGTFDFTFSFSPVNLVQTAPVRPPDGAQPGGAPLPADPTGAVSLFDAVKRDLGLKLEMQKRPMPVLVIDAMEQQPIE